MHTSCRMLDGIFPPVPTPFDDRFELATVPLAENIAWWIRQGVHGIVVLGSNGEAVHLSDTERAEVVATARQALGEGRPLIAGSGALSTRHTIALTAAAAAEGANAVLVLPPFYYRTQMTDQALLEHFRSVADSSPVPVVLYNMPRCTGIDLSVDVVSSLAEHENIWGMKDSGGDLVKLASVRAAVPTSFRLLAGSAGFLLPALTIGATGGIVALANLAPAECVALYRFGLDGDVGAAEALQFAITPLNTAVTARWGVAALKAALDILGIYGGPVRPPLLPVEERQREELRKLLVQAGVLLTGERSQP